MVAETSTKHERLQIRDGISILCQESNHGLQVILETLQKDQLLNELAPKDTLFSIRRDIKSPLWQCLTRTCVDSKSIKVSLAGKEKEILPYAILHGIARLQLHSDPVWHETSHNAHRLLSNQLSEIRGYDKVPKPESLEEVHAWEIISQDERKTSELAVGLVSDLCDLDIDPLPYVKNMHDLTNLVNHRAILRTAAQININPKWTEGKIKVSLTLPEYWVAAVMKK